MPEGHRGVPMEKVTERLWIARGGSDLTSIWVLAINVAILAMNMGLLAIDNALVARCVVAPQPESGLRQETRISVVVCARIYVYTGYPINLYALWATNHTRP